MAHEYCTCDDTSALGGTLCDCSGLTNYCTCDGYVGGEAYNQFHDNFTEEGCPSLIFTPENTYNSTDVNTLYNLLSDKIKSGEIIYSEDIEDLWQSFLNLIQVKKENNYAGVSLTYNYSKPSNISSGEIIDADHFEHLKNNIYSVHTGTPQLNDNTGGGFTTPDGIKINNTNGITTTEYDPGDTIFASEVAKLAKWLGASMYQCVCNYNVQVKCCSCNIVCDCNY